MSKGGAGLASGLQLLVAAQRAERLARARLHDRDPAGSLYRHAADTVPRYAALAVRGRLRAETLPVVSREDLVRSPRMYLSTAFEASELRWKQTSGTSGVPLRVPRDPASEYLFVHDTYRLLFDQVPELAGRGRPGAVAVLQVNDNPKRAAAAGANPALGYATVLQVVIGCGSRADLDTARMSLDARPDLLTGRPRALLAFGELIDELNCAGAEIGLSAVVCSGDNLYPDVRRSLEHSFGAPVYNAYASREAGLVALECERGVMHPVEERAAIEVLSPGSERPVPEGEGELIVTGYENWAMPLLRYRTGDEARVSAAPCQCGRGGATITELSGRDSTYFTIAGRRINPSLLNETFERLPLRQFQLRQVEPARFVFRWLPNGELGASADVRVRSIVSEALQAFGPTAVDVEKVSRIGTPGEKVQRFTRDPGAGRC